MNLCVQTQNMAAPASSSSAQNQPHSLEHKAETLSGGFRDMRSGVHPPKYVREEGREPLPLLSSPDALVDDFEELDEDDGFDEVVVVGIELGDRGEETGVMSTADREGIYTLLLVCCLFQVVAAFFGVFSYEGLV